MSGKHALPYVGNEPDLAAEVRDIVNGEMIKFLSDIEFRLAQAYDVENRFQVGGGKVYAEDMKVMRHQLTGYTLSANKTSTGSTSTGNIAWNSLHVVYNGTDYPITDGDTTTFNSVAGPYKYVWFDPNASTTVLQQGNTKPDFTNPARPTAALLFVNNGGTPYDCFAGTIPGVVADQAIDAGALQKGIVTPAKMNTLQHLLY